ncbi:LINE-1 type transposase domain containing protein 1 [Dissostichus eleginoides]|uniref:LINE-1 type transposase domain containing protein 1 n=1 Tax=Dissostichus eleginoides TaxID=100907 RepID=A0AAD9EUX6_DISEL|nr:LINE-1 type transposase domain containing protein 1 [Dissostichus eleginoides]
MPGRPPKTGPQTSAASKTSTSQAKVSSAAACQNTEAMAENVEVLGAIHAMQSNFSKKLDDVLEGICGLKALSKSYRINAPHFEMKVEDQENRGRRNNLRLIGLPEKAEGQDVCAFLEQWLPRALGTDTFSTLPVIERAHRIGRLIAGQDPKPRAVIMRFLNYRDKENAMRAARRQGTVRFENHNGRLYPDHSAETHRQQKLFEAVKKQLQSMGLRYGMFYPAIFVVTHNGHRHSFNTVPDAEKFVQKLQKDARPTPVPN